MVLQRIDRESWDCPIEQTHLAKSLRQREVWGANALQAQPLIPTEQDMSSHTPARVSALNPPRLGKLAASRKSRRVPCFTSPQLQLRHAIMG